MTSKAQNFSDGMAVTGKLALSCTGYCNYGENIASGGPTKNMTAGIIKLVDKWYSQNTDYDYVLGQPKSGKMTGSFTALVWKGSTKVGFGAGVKASNGNIYILITFSPPGNMKGGYIKNVLPPPASDPTPTEPAPAKDEPVEQNSVDESVLVPPAADLIGTQSFNRIVQNAVFRVKTYAF